ncbi:hypothetical protein RP20_CCG010049 [Aedes albopictus]|nr:hypothetical protein RP20_CCG010049 [Aedes albopictus]
MLQKLLLLLGKEKFVSVDILIRISGGGHKYVDQASREELKDILIPGRTLAVTCWLPIKPKKFGSTGAHTCYQESFS